MMPGPSHCEAGDALRRDVLIVEDQPGTRLALVELMRRRGYNPIGVESAEEALRRIGASGCPDVVLADLDLPGMDGFSMVRQILEHNPETKAVMITAQSPSERAEAQAPLQRDIADPRGMRPVPWLRKPLDIGQLLRVLDQVA